jgi:hypothetical protein
MKGHRTTRFGFLVAVIASTILGTVATAQRFVPRVATAADWAALARLPDFNGVWEVASGGPNRRGADGARLPGPSLTPEYAARKKAFEASTPEDHQATNCLPQGMPTIMGRPSAMEFLLTPGQVTIVFEAYTQVRHIYTDGRPLPRDPPPTFHGTSVGRWMGDTLFVDTVGFSPMAQLDRSVPHSDKMRIHERFKLAGPDTMNIETTILDPEVLTAPYTTNRSLKRHRGRTIADYICEENNRNVADGPAKAGFDLADPGGDSSDQR